jgi:hypothetical protein
MEVGGIFLPPYFCPKLQVPSKSAEKIQALSATKEADCLVASAFARPTLVRSREPGLRLAFPARPEAVGESHAPIGARRISPHDGPSAVFAQPKRTAHRAVRVSTTTDLQTRGS